jgi:chromosome segregation ATPase
LRLDMDKLETGLADKVQEAQRSSDEYFRKALIRAQESAAAIDGELSQKLASIKAQASELRERVESTQAKLFGKIEDESKKLSTTLDDLDKREKNFAAQTKIFERADELKLQLQRDVEGLRADISKAESFRGELSDLGTELAKVRKLEEDVNQKMTRFLAEKRRVDSLEDDFKKLLTISQAVDQKLESVTSSNDTITDVEAKLRKVLDISSEAEAKYDRLEKKSNVLESASEGIDRNFRDMQEMEKRLNGYAEAIKDLPARIGELGRSVESIAGNQAQVQETANRLTTLDETLGDIEKRITAMQTAREWLAGTETRLQDLANKAQEQVKLFGDLMKEESAAQRKERGAPAMSTRETVAKLVQQGWNVEEIAHATKLSRGEVELILEMLPKNSPRGNR